VARPIVIAVVNLLALLTIAGADAAEGPILTSDTWKVRSTGNLSIDAGLAVGLPAALPTGLSTGVGAGVLYGHTLAWGARASWTTATESTLAWAVTQSDLRLRAVGALQHAVGRATLALRLGLGATVVHETRARIDGTRSGLTGSALQTSAIDTLPAGDLEGVVALHIAGPWTLVLGGGPSATVLDGGLHTGWTGEMGVAWQP
jgi:hypothetical protein